MISLALLPLGGSCSHLIFLVVAMIEGDSVLGDVQSMVMVDSRKNVCSKAQRPSSI
jgi:hypothetical protein